MILGFSSHYDCRVVNNEYRAFFIVARVYKVNAFSLMSEKFEMFQRNNNKNLSS